MKMCQKPTAENTGSDMLWVMVDDDFGFILGCALRYAIGRRTYASSTVAGYILTLLSYLSDRDLSVMKTDIEEHGDKRIYGEQPYGDPDIDEPEWMRLLNAIKEELKKRGK